VISKPTPLRPFRLQPGFQHYAWGDTKFVPNLYGIENPNGKPYAEVWMGAHPARPAIALLEEGDIGLDALIAEAPERVLGADLAARFDGLPYLMKILAAERPLSIQVHPTAIQAVEGFRRENRAGIPLDAPHRNYRDPNHKPELIVALEPFHALCGFRSHEEITAALARMPEIAALLPSYEPTAGGLRALVGAYLALPARDRDAALSTLLARLRVEQARAPFGEEAAEHWALVADREHSRPDHPDAGLLFVFLLNLIRLEPGVGMYLPARTPHSYLRGVGIEIMASSDNVIRCGLTPKHVDPAALLRTVDFASAAPAIVRASAVGSGPTRVYPTSAAEFELLCTELASDSDPLERTAHGPEILLVTAVAGDGSVTVRSAGELLELGPGGVCLAPDSAHYELAATGTATVYTATVPTGA